MAIVLMILGVIVWYHAWQIYALSGTLEAVIHGPDFLLLVLIGSVLVGFAGMISAINQVRHAIKPKPSLWRQMFGDLDSPDVPKSDQSASAVAASKPGQVTDTDN